jgi:hypothetical protein
MFTRLRIGAPVLARGIAAVLAVTCLVGAVGTPASAQSHRVVPAAASFTVRLSNMHSNYCLAVAGMSPYDGAQIVQWECNTAQDKYWTFRPAFTIGDEQYYHVVNNFSNKCLGVAGSSIGSGAAIVQWACADGYNDHAWTIDFIAFNNTLYLRNYYSDLVLGIAGSSTREGAPAVQWTKSHPPVDQEWQLIL